MNIAPQVLVIDMFSADPQSSGSTARQRLRGTVTPHEGNIMADKTLTRMDLSEAVFRNVGLSRNESATLVSQVLQHVSDALVNDEQVKVSGFGTFSTRNKNARVGRNPKTGEEAPIPPRRVLTFRPSHLMKDRIASENSPRKD